MILGTAGMDKFGSVVDRKNMKLESKSHRYTRKIDKGREPVSLIVLFNFMQFVARSACQYAVFRCITLATAVCLGGSAASDSQACR
jgi:hypothetical protein